MAAEHVVVTDRLVEWLAARRRFGRDLADDDDALGIGLSSPEMFLQEPVRQLHVIVHDGDPLAARTQDRVVATLRLSGVLLVERQQSEGGALNARL